MTKKNLFRQKLFYGQINPTKNKSILVYNPLCDFCFKVALYLNYLVKKDKLKIVPNTEEWAKYVYEVSGGNPMKFKRDVHLIQWDGVYSGSDAVIKTLSKIRFLGFLDIGNKFFLIRWIFKLLYFILKKTKVLYKYFLTPIV